MREEVRLDFIWDGKYECATFEVVENIKVNLLQGVHINMKNFNINVLYDEH